MLTILAILIGFLLVSELVVRFFYPKPPRWPQPQIRTKLDRRAGYLNRPNQNAYTVDAPVHINSFGFRGPEFNPEREDGQVRILGLGNSLSFGAGVADDETYFAYLEKELSGHFPQQRIQVLNAAIIGFTIRQYIPFMQSVLPKLKPDLVLLGAHWRDLHFNPRFGQLTNQVDSEAWKMIKKKFDDRNVKNGAGEGLKGEVFNRVKDLMRHWRSIYVCNYHLMQLKEEIKPPNFKMWQKSFLSGDETEPIRQRRIQARKTLSRMKEICEEQNVRLAIVIFPDYKQITRLYPSSLWPSILIEICRDLNLPYVELLSATKKAYEKLGGSSFIPYDITHYSADSNRYLAKEVFDFLIKEEVLTRHTHLQASLT